MCPPRYIARTPRRSRPAPRLAVTRREVPNEAHSAVYGPARASFPGRIRYVAENSLNARKKRARVLPAVAGIRPVTCAQRTKLLSFRLRYQISLGVSAEGVCSLAVRMPRQRMIHGRAEPVVSGVAARVRGFGCLRWYTKKLVRGRRSTVAQKIQTVFVDDLDGSEAEGTVRFGLDGAEYEIDLNAEHAQALREALAPYVGAARRAGGGGARRPGRAARRAPGQRAQHHRGPRVGQVPGH